MVADLINPDLHIWRNEEVMVIFHRVEAEAICQIPLSRGDVNDAIISLHNSKELFTVKSVYQVAKKLGNQVGTSGGYAERKIWAAIWKRKHPKKIKIFGWRACHDILLIAGNLTRRKIIQENKCPLCMREVESRVHALSHCVAVQDIWAGSIRKVQKCRHWQLDMKQLMEDLLEWLTYFSDLDRSGYGSIIRNDKGEVMAAMSASGPKVSTSDEAELHACRRAIEFAMDARFSRLIIEGDSSNVIHSIFSPLEKFSLFGNVVNDIRHLIGGGFSGLEFATLGEEQTRKAVEFAIDTGFAELIVKGDSINVMRALSSSSSDLSACGNVVEDIQ
ncbi:uncharacterized protein LOC142634767 [Castanea sativa]|uniref:uncharacterized protein LOC142634767 n=1 Tax=Castanea sativa TaxID=21020 RepID=UPI003F64D83F